MDLVSASSEKLEPLPPDPSLPLPPASADAMWVEEMTEKSKRGVAEAQFALGQYLFAKGQYLESFQQFELAAVRGDLQAKYQLGVMSYDGKGIREDAVSGAVWVSCPRLLPCAGQRVPIHAGSGR